MEHKVNLNRFDSVEIMDEKGISYVPVGLENSIREEIADLDSAFLLKTYLVYFLDSETNKKELACVFSLRNSSLNFQETSDSNPYNEIMPGVELVFLASDKNFRNKHPETKGLGAAVFDAFIVPIVQQISELSGCKYLFLFAINNEVLVNYYINRMDFNELPPEQEKLVVNNLTTEFNEGCKFLYQLIECM